MADASQLRDALRTIMALETELARTRERAEEPIAIVGMAMRSPFEAFGKSMWQGLAEGVDASRDVPPDRWDKDALYDPDPRASGEKVVTKRGSFLSDVQHFDARFFGIAGVEAEAMDPQQRLVLEVTWEAFADAGLPLERLRQLRTSIFLGICTRDYLGLCDMLGHLAEDLPASLVPYLGTGSAQSVAAGRVSYVLGLTGPAVAVETACSSSLVSLHLACASLRSGESDVAVAGGVNLILSPAFAVIMSKLGALSNDGRCRSFDAAASGYGRGEGCGMVVLKRLSDAVKDRDRIFAVVRGSAINQDGRSDGLTAPNGLAQQRMLRAALSAARLSPNDVQYVEAFGTGTALGDPIEIEALGEVFGADRPVDAPLVIGSVKTNMGHLEGAAGISGIIKTVLCIQHRQLAPNLHFKTLNPHVSPDLPLRVQTELGSWPQPDKPLIAGVSSFGFSGTNAHVVLSEPPAEAVGAWNQADSLAAGAALLPLCVSAKTQEALRACAARFADYLDSPVELPTTWRDVAFTSSVRATHLEHRVVVVGANPREWRDALARVAAGESRGHAVVGDASRRAKRVVFVFSGQGSEWCGMGRELVEREPVFRAVLEECDRHIRAQGDWSLLDELRRSDDASQLRRPDVAQPALVAIQIGIVRLLASWGVAPSAVVGHGAGEIAAACAAGVLTLEEACRLANARGRGASEVRAALQGLEPAAPRIPIASTLTGRATGATFDVEHWVSQIGQPVLFPEATRALLENDLELFVEIGPHPTLLPAIEAIGARASKRTTVVTTLQQHVDQQRCLLESLATLHCAGYEVSWDKLFGVAGRMVSLPSYAWQRQRYWLPTRKGTKPRAPAGRWALIHSHVASSEELGKSIFEVELDLSEGPHAYLADHKVQGGPWLPAVAFLDMALQVAAETFPARSATLEDVTLSQALMMTLGESVRLQFVLQREQDGASAFRIVSRPVSDRDVAWTEHVNGRIGWDRPAPAEVARASLRDLQRRCAQEVAARALYEGLENVGMPLGPAFRGVERGWSGNGEALSKLIPLEKLTDQRAGYVVHPLAFDPAIQSARLAFDEATAGRMYVPATIGAVRVLRNTAPRWAHVSLREVTETTVEGDLRLFDDDGEVAVEVTELRGRALERAGDRMAEWSFEVVWRPSVPPVAESSGAGRWLVLADDAGLAKALVDRLLAHGVEVVIARHGDGFRKDGDRDFTVDPRTPAPLTRLMAEAFGDTPPRRVVHLWSLDTRRAAADVLDERTLQHAQDLTCTSSLHLVQALTSMGWSEPPRLFIVTRACQAAVVSRDVVFPEQALAWGFGATVVHEMPELGTTMIDLGESVTVERLAQELTHADAEDRIALRGHDRLVARLVQRTAPTKAAGALRPLHVKVEGYALDPLQPGRVDSLMLRPAVIPSAGRGEVVIRTHASGVNFRDVLMTMGMYPGLGEGRLPMGSEFAGVVHAVGDGVQTLQPGDEVVGTGAHGFDAYAVTREELVVKKPSTLSFAQAAALPSVVMTVLYALQHVARLAKGERVLIHAATGGVGLAAVQYAKHVGAEIFATAGSEEKRAYLRTQGIAHVYDSRTLAWADEVKRDTGGRGVDVVLNSLAGEAIAKGVSVLRPFGRFLEIGKRDIYENTALGLYAMRHNITLSAVALDELASERPREARALLEETFRLVADGTLSPLPVETYPVSRAVEAFEQLARARHIGKVVVTSEETVTVRDAARSDDVQPGKTYLVTGGLGGLGLVVARRLAKLGATHLALMSRSAPSESARSAIAELEQSGVRVHVVRGDVANRASLDAALAELSQTAPPLVGLVHAAGVLDDATVATLSAARIGPVLAPKVTGAVALEAALPDLALRVYFASVAGVLGSGGQAPYAAANAFLDAFAHHLAGQSRRALSLDWGAWADVGLAARGDRVDNVTRQGLAMISPDDGAELFERLLASSSVQVAPIPIDFRQWRQANPTLAGMPLLREVVSSAKRGAQKNAGLFRRLEGATSDEERVTIIEEYLRATIAAILRSSPDGVDRSTPFKQLGFDSLMSVSLKNTLERDLDVPLSTGTLYAHPSVDKLAAYVGAKLLAKLDARTEAETSADPPRRQAEHPGRPDVKVDVDVDEALRLELDELRRIGIQV